MVRETARVAKPIEGDSLYQERARCAFPLLVRQAEAGRPIFYGDLAEELGMPNARNLNYPLGSIGHTLEKLSKAWKEKIPPLQSLVINRNTGVPGEGVGWFLRAWGDFADLPSRKRREVVAGAHSIIFAYPRWREVLRAVALKPAPHKFSRAVREAAVLPPSGKGQGGEGERHRALKLFVARCPSVIGLPGSTPTGRVESPLPSGDSLDVFFAHGSTWIAAEVKTALSPEADLIRGLFQCIKYRAVMEAMQAAEGRPRAARAILVLEARLPPSLVPLRNTLGVEVCEEVTSRS
jgi:hypothetical protein